MTNKRRINSPTGKTLSSEAVVANWICNLIEQGELYDSISGMHKVDAILDSVSCETLIPRFSIDYTSRLAIARSSKFALEQLRNLKLVSVDKSIALDKRDTLRPDIIAYNPESRVVVVFEIKKDKAPERQAISELAGYEHELQNHFPFLSNMDICYVVIARNWSTLMTHGVAGLTTWSSKQCLPLKLDYDAVPREIQVASIDAWNLTGSVEIQDSALQCYDLALYSKRSTEEANDLHSPIPRIIQTAISSIAREGDRMRSHGFLMLWRDVSPFGIDWAITICVLDYGVFSKYSTADERATTSQMSKFFKKEFQSEDGSMTQSGYRVIDQAKSLLSEEFDVHIESHQCWVDKKDEHRHRSIPELFEFWGAPGEFSRNFISHAGVRGTLLPFLKDSHFDWKHPVVAFPLISYMIGRPPFRSGKVFCSDLLKAGKCLGLLAGAFSRSGSFDTYGEHLDAKTQREIDQTTALIGWVLPEAVGFMAEFFQLHLSYEEIPPPPALSNDPETAVPSIEAIVEWVHEELIGEDEPFHTGSFQLGLRLNGAFELLRARQLEDLSSPNLDSAMLEAKDFCAASFALIKAAAENEHHPKLERQMAADHISNVQQLLRTTSGSTDDIKSALERAPRHAILSCLEASCDAIDSFIFPVLHETRKVSMAKIDVEALKNGTSEILRRGYSWPAVIIDPAGTIGIGKVPKHAEILEKLKSVDEEVFFYDQRVAFSVVQRVRWDELLSRIFEDD